MNNILFNEIINDNEDEDDNNIDETKICLITNSLLDNNNIKLDCGHKFNYLPLYNEIIYQKTKKILDNSKLKFNEIKCPYCRNITYKLLPFYKYYEIKQIKGVNYPTNLTMNFNNCEYIDKKNNKCNNSACITKFGIFCNKHLKYTKKEEDIIENIDNEFYKNYKKKTLKDLKEELRLYKLKLSGKKEELINRLYIYKNQ